MYTYLQELVERYRDFEHGKKIDFDTKKKALYDIYQSNIFCHK